MLAFTFSIALLTALQATASPVESRKVAKAIPFAARGSPGKVFDAAAALRDRVRVSNKYKGSKYSKHVAALKAGETFEVNDTVVDKRSVDEPFDIALVRRASGADPLTDDYEEGLDELYYGPLSIGTPAQQSTTDFDTGSSDLVVPTTQCTSGCTGPLFNTGASSTYKGTSTSFSIQYEDGSGATGKVATDTVTIAGLTATNQGFGAVSKETNGFGSGPNAGLLGLGWPANAESGKTPFFVTLVNKGTLTSNVFSMYLARAGASGSELCLGCINSAKYTGSVTYYTLDSASTGGTQYYWNTLSKGFSYNGGTSSGSFSAVIDSGTTLVYIPTAAAKALYAKIPGAKSASSTVGAGFYTFPCSSTLGPITLGFGSATYAVNPADFNLGQVSSGSSSCVGGIIGEDIGDNLAIIGDEWMKSWYTVFDYSNKRVGFAKAV